MIRVGNSILSGLIYLKVITGMQDFIMHEVANISRRNEDKVLTKKTKKNKHDLPTLKRITYN